MPPTSQTTFTGLPLPQLNQKDYPNVQHWGPEKYNAIRKGGKRVQDEDESIKSQDRPAYSIFMEDEDGNPIKNRARKDIRTTAKSFFEQLLSINRTPKSWGHAALDIRNEFIHQLESEYPWIRLCEGHWKATAVATTTYPHWYTSASQRKAAETAKQHVKATGAAVHLIDVDADDQGEGGPSKRALTEDDDTRAAKRPRTEDLQPASTIRPTPTRKGKQRQQVCDSNFLNPGCR